MTPPWRAFRHRAALLGVVVALVTNLCSSPADARMPTPVRFFEAEEGWPDSDPPWLTESSKGASNLSDEDSQPSKVEGAQLFAPDLRRVRAFTRDGAAAIRTWILGRPILSVGIGAAITIRRVE